MELIIITINIIIIIITIIIIIIISSSNCVSTPRVKLCSAERRCPRC